MHASPWPTPRAAEHRVWKSDELKRPLFGHHLESAYPFELRGHAESLSARIPYGGLPPGRWIPMRLARQAVAIPHIVYNDPITPTDFASLSETEQLMAVALYSTHHDGYVRADAVAQLVGRREQWTAPFLLLRLGDMVEQVVEPVATALDAQAPDSEALRSMLAESAALNPFIFRRARSQSVGYWYTYYRREHAAKEDHPGVKACNAIAAEVEPGALLRW